MVSLLNRKWIREKCLVNLYRSIDYKKKIRNSLTATNMAIVFDIFSEIISRLDCITNLSLYRAYFAITNMLFRQVYPVVQNRYFFSFFLLTSIWGYFIFLLFTATLSKQLIIRYRLELLSLKHHNNSSIPTPNVCSFFS